jgi:hypothetical protein
MPRAGNDRHSNKLGDTTYFEADGPHGERQRRRSDVLGSVRYTTCG